MVIAVPTLLHNITINVTFTTQWRETCWWNAFPVKGIAQAEVNSVCAIYLVSQSQFDYDYLIKFQNSYLFDKLI